MKYSLKGFALATGARPAWPDPAQMIRDQIRKDAESAAKKTEVADLTEGEKFALAFYAGIPTQPPGNPYTDLECERKWTLTTVPCSFFHDGEKWIVAMRAEDER